MSIESILERIAVALERGAASPVTVLPLPAAPIPGTPVGASAKKAAKTAVAEAKKATEAAAPEGVTSKQMGDKIVELIQGNQRAAAVKILAGVGAKAISEVPEDKYAEVYAAAVEILSLTA